MYAIIWCDLNYKLSNKINIIGYILSIYLVWCGSYDRKLPHGQIDPIKRCLLIMIFMMTLATTGATVVNQTLSSLEISTPVKLLCYKVPV